MHDVASALEYEHAADARAARAEQVRQLREAAAAGASDVVIHESSIVYPFLLLPFGSFLAYSGWFDRSVAPGLAIGLCLVGSMVAAAVLVLLVRYTRRVLTLTADGVVAGDTLLPWSDVAACEVAPGYAGPFTAITRIKLIHRPGCTPPRQRSWGRIGLAPPRADGAAATQISLFAKARLISGARLFQLFDERIRAARAKEALHRLGVR